MTELTTKAYIPVHSDSGMPIGEGLIFKEPLKDMRHDELVGRKDAEAAIAAIQDECDERGIDIDVLKQNLELAKRQRDAWKDTAAQHHRNQEFYYDLVTDIGAAIGRPAYTSDDGSVQYEPLALKVRDIAVAAYKSKNRFVRAFRMLMRGF